MGGFRLTKVGGGGLDSWMVLGLGIGGLGVGFHGYTVYACYGAWAIIGRAGCLGGSWCFWDFSLEARKSLWSA